MVPVDLEMQVVVQVPVSSPHDDPIVAKMISAEMKRVSFILFMFWFYI